MLCDECDLIDLHSASQFQKAAIAERDCGHNLRDPMEMIYL